MPPAPPLEPAPELNPSDGSAGGAVPGAPFEQLALPPGDSNEQREAEGVMLQLLGERVGTKLETRRVRLSPGVWVDVDGASDDPPILCEAFAHQGSAKAGQSRKIGQDILKLLLLRRVAEESGTPLPRLILLFADPAAAQACGSRSWKGEAVRRFGIQVELVDLPPDLHDRVLQAQERQRR